MQTSNIRNHLHVDQHFHAMSLLKREQAKASNSACCSYSGPIVHALSKLPDLEKVQLQVKFDLAYFIAREKMSFNKYPRSWEVCIALNQIQDIVSDWDTYSAGHQESRKCIFLLNVHFLSHTSCY